MSTCLITKVEQQWAMLILGWVTASDGFAACHSRLKPLLALFGHKPYNFTLYRPCGVARIPVSPAPTPHLTSLNWKASVNGRTSGTV